MCAEIEITQYQLSRNWKNLMPDWSAWHGYCVIEGEFGSVVASYREKEDCEKFIREYNKAIRHLSKFQPN